MDNPGCHAPRRAQVGLVGLPNVESAASWDGIYESAFNDEPQAEEKQRETEEKDRFVPVHNAPSIQPESPSLTTSTSADINNAGTQVPAHIPPVSLSSTAPLAEEPAFRRLDPPHAIPDFSGNVNDQLFAASRDLLFRHAPAQQLLPQESNVSTTTGMSARGNTETSLPERRHAHRVGNDGYFRDCALDRTAVDVTDWTEDYEQSGCRCVVQ